MTNMNKEKIPLPPNNLRFMNENDDKFIKIGQECLEFLLRHGFIYSSSIIDIGSGYGRLAYAILNHFDFTGSYVGVDILPKHIAWCRNNFTPRFENIKFELLDIKNERYNPLGKLRAETAVFSFNKGMFQFCTLFSVFTHMFEQEIRNYLREIYRITTDDAVTISTFFLLNKDREDRVINGDAGLTMKFKLNDYTRYFNATDKLHAISFDENFIFSLLSEHGFKIKECLYGHWAAGNSKHYQDILILTKK